MVPSGPYVVDSSPVSDFAPEVEEDQDQLSEAWVLVLLGLQVLQNSSAHVPFCPDPAANGALVQVQGQWMRWEISPHSLVLGWPFCPEEQPVCQASTLPCPSWEEVHHSLSTLSVLVGFSPPVVATDGDENPRCLVGLLDGGARRSLPVHGMELVDTI